MGWDIAKHMSPATQRSSGSKPRHWSWGWRAGYLERRQTMPHQRAGNFRVRMKMVADGNWAEGAQGKARELNSWDRKKR